MIGKIGWKGLEIIWLAHCPRAVKILMEGLESKPATFVLGSNQTACDNVKMEDDDGGVELCHHGLRSTYILCPAFLLM